MTIALALIGAFVVGIIVGMFLGIKIAIYVESEQQQDSERGGRLMARILKNKQKWHWL